MRSRSYKLEQIKKIRFLRDELLINRNSLLNKAKLLSFYGAKYRRETDYYMHSSVGIEFKDGKYIETTANTVSECVHKMLNDVYFYSYKLICTDYAN